MTRSISPRAARSVAAASAARGSGRRRRPVIGLALGGGGALGIAHIGVIRVLEENGIVPDLVTGTSIGSIVGAAYVFGKLDEVEAQLQSMTLLEMMKLADIQLWKSGLLGGDAIVRQIRKHIGIATFAEADRPFAVVAADIAHDEEVILHQGDVAAAIRASISLPGIFTPVLDHGRVLIDGGMKDPVPVSVARQMGAELVIAVDVTGDFAGQAAASGIIPGSRLRTGILEVVTVAFAMVMKELALARNLLHPPDVLMTPAIGHIKQYAFDRGGELIAAGREAATAALPAIEAALARPAASDPGDGGRAAGA